MVCNFCFSNSVYNQANIFRGLIDYELNGLLSASHLVDYISIHIPFDLVRYLLNSHFVKLTCYFILKHFYSLFKNKTDITSFPITSRVIFFFTVLITDAVQCGILNAILKKNFCYS